MTDDTLTETVADAPETPEFAPDEAAPTAEEEATAAEAEAAAADEALQAQSEQERAKVVQEAVEAKNEQAAEAAQVNEVEDVPSPDYVVSLAEDHALETPLRVQVAGLEPVEFDSDTATVTVEAERASVLASVPYLSVEVAE